MTLVFILSLALISTVQAKDYSKRTIGYNLSVASCTIEVHGNVTCHSSGNTRWSYYWETYSGNNIKSCFVKKTYKNITYDSRLILAQRIIHIYQKLQQNNSLLITKKDRYHIIKTLNYQSLKLYRGIII